MYIPNLENEKIEKDYIMHLIKTYVERNNLDKYINKIFLNDILTIITSHLGMYVCVDKAIFFNLDNFVAVVQNFQDYHLLNTKKDKTIYLYQQCFTIIFHELEHAKQYKLIDDNTIYKNILLKNDVFEGNYKEAYINFHDTFPTEHAAEVEGTYYASKLLKEWGICDTKEYRDSLVNEYLVNNNKCISPYERLLSKLKTHDDNIYDFNLYDRLKYGLPVTVDELDKVYACSLKTPATELKTYLKRF